MTQKKTYTPKPKPLYIEDATDGDGDGLVQDNTPFERPVDTKITEHILGEGENIQTVASTYAPAGMSRNDYAKKLFDLNKQWSIGSVIRLG